MLTKMGDTFKELILKYNIEMEEWDLALISAKSSRSS